MSDKVANVQAMFTELGAEDVQGRWVANKWDTYNKQRQTKIDQWIETQNYIFATDTTTTTNQTLPWKNSTTLPKLCQIRDNLHSNYLSALFPNERWLQWVPYTSEAASHSKAKIITAYIENKTRMSRYRSEVSKLLLDYIDYGNAFVTTSFEKRYNTKKDGTKIPGYIGPVAHRISPMDIVFNPLAPSIERTWKIIRTVKTIGELLKASQTESGMEFWAKVVSNRLTIKARTAAGGYTAEDFNLAQRIQIDGFGNLYEYYQSDSVEILEFYGDYYDENAGTLSVNRMVTVVDRCWSVRDAEIDTLDGSPPIRHVGWRIRPDNLWAMGPLDNLVGMQYRIDHLENLKADAMDLTVHPPLVIVGEVESFVWGPGTEIHVDEGGSVNELTKSMNAIITADQHIKDLLDQMELFAGAPREAMGVRTPGEKTALEVSTLMNAAIRIFQEKITNFEIELMEPNLNDQLEISVLNFDGSDVIRTLDTSLGVQQFSTITRDDISAAGVVRPIGARHFAQSANDLQTIIGIANSPIWQVIQPHTSGIALTDFVNDVTNLTAYQIFRPDVAVGEAAQTAGLLNQGQEDLQTAQAMPAMPSSVPAK